MCHNLWFGALISSPAAISAASSRTSPVSGSRRQYSWSDFSPYNPMGPGSRCLTILSRVWPMSFSSKPSQEKSSFRHASHHSCSSCSWDFSSVIMFVALVRHGHISFTSCLTEIRVQEELAYIGHEFLSKV